VDGDIHASDADDFHRKLWGALAEVNETARICLLLRTLENLEYSHISRLLGIPEGTAMSHVHRTRKQLREKLMSSTDEYSGEGRVRS
jgi:RNA polymerase sigma factor (sigma-70 family)